MPGEGNEQDAHYTTWCDLQAMKKKADEYLNIIHELRTEAIHYGIKMKELHRRAQAAEALVDMSDAAIVARVINEKQPGKPLGRMQANFTLMTLAVAARKYLDWNCDPNTCGTFECPDCKKDQEAAANLEAILSNLGYGPEYETESSTTSEGSSSPV